jgi:predicted ATP-dependent endonuclease of OLD family
MKLKKVQIDHFRHILDSTPVDVQTDVTCLIGKNESGKTTFLEALWRLNPANGKPSLDLTKYYPAWLEKRHRREGRELEEHAFVKATFEIDDKDERHVAKKLGDGVLTCTEIVVSRRYDGKLICDGVTVDDSKVTNRIVAKLDLPASFQSRANSCTSVEALQALAIAIDREGETESAQSIKAALSELLGKSETVHRLASDTLIERLPKFFYFRDYSRLPEIVKIRELLQTAKEDLDLDHRTARSLLEMAGAESDYLLNPDYQQRKRELENVANALSQDVLEYWTTNKHLRVLIDITQRTENVSKGQTVVVDELHVRMYDDSHMLSLPFGERSSGFQWFFSFLAAFSEYESSKDSIVILLDEPGVGLHARAQKDFLRFIDERLSKRQVIYSTHSPFMVQPQKLERARLVEDRGIKFGAVVTSDVLTTDADTLFPLQGALGYDIAQHLLLGQHNIVVEGASDYIYLTVFSDYLGEQGRASLDARWSLVPVGGADQIPTFVALLGIHLDVTALIDSRKQGNQRLTKLSQEGFLKSTRVMPVGEIVGKAVADIEDLFTTDDYLKLYNAAFGKSVTVEALTGNDSVVSKIARFEGVDRFNHNKPAEVLLRDRTMLTMLSAETLENFDKLIQRLNRTISGA